MIVYTFDLVSTSSSIIFDHCGQLSSFTFPCIIGARSQLWSLSVYESLELLGSPLLWCKIFWMIRFIRFHHCLFQINCCIHLQWTLVCRENNLVHLFFVSLHSSDNSPTYCSTWPHCVYTIRTYPFLSPKYHWVETFLERYPGLYVRKLSPFGRFLWKKWRRSNNWALSWQRKS